MSVMKATFTCRVPKSIFDYTENNGVLVYDYDEVKHPARVSLYGHGLLGSRGEVNNSSHVKWASREANLMFCAMNWTGFSTEDVGTAVAGLVDMNNFPRFIDRQLQGMLNWLVLQEAIVAAPGEGGFMDQPAFNVNGDPVFQLDYTDAGQTQGGIFYDGNSQGGIMGGALVAVSPRICKGILGVPGMNYSTLLRRSKDFQAERPIDEGVQQTITSQDLAVGYSDAFDTSYQNPMDQAFLMSLIQMIWDRGETNGYAEFLAPDNSLRSHPVTGANPGEAQCDKDLLLHVAFGDHQVSHTTAEVMARSAQMARVENAPGPGRHHDGPNAFFGIPPINAGNGLFGGSAIIEWDSGPTEVDVPPTENTPPRTKSDPHEHARRAIEAREQKMLYLRSNGQIRPQCGDSQFSNQKTGYCFSGEMERRQLETDKLIALDAVRRSLN